MASIGKSSHLKKTKKQTKKVKNQKQNNWKKGIICENK
jgi:hypothetical protein